MISSIGLFKLREWARVVTILFAGVGIAWGISSQLIGFPTLPASPDDPLAKVLGVYASILVYAWEGLVVWYFLRPSVKAQFASKVGAS